MKKFFAISVLLLITSTFTSHTKSEWKTINDNELYSFEIPVYMEAMNDLNSEASHQFGYIETKGGEVLELYTIVLFETKKEIESYNLKKELDILTYSELAVKNLKGGLKKYKVLTKKPVIQNLNEMKCVKSEMWGALGSVEVYYKMAIFESDMAFYQVLSWTINNQKSVFYNEMDQIANSFREQN